MQCPKCGGKHVEIREYYDDGVVTDQLHECQSCFETGDKYDFAGGRYPEEMFRMARDKIRFLKSRCRKKNLEFNLDMDDVLFFYSLKYCELTGIELIDAPDGMTKVRFNNRTLDRIDNKQGYIKGNILVICHSANKLKAKYEDPGHKEFEAPADRVLDIVKQQLLSEWKRYPETYTLGKNNIAA